MLLVGVFMVELGFRASGSGLAFFYPGAVLGIFFFEIFLYNLIIRWNPDVRLNCYLVRPFVNGRGVKWQSFWIILPSRV